MIPKTTAYTPDDPDEGQRARQRIRDQEDAEEQRDGPGEAQQPPVVEPFPCEGSAELEEAEDDRAEGDQQDDGQEGDARPRQREGGDGEADDPLDEPPPPRSPARPWVTAVARATTPSAAA